MIRDSITKNIGGRPAFQERHIFEARDKLMHILFEKEGWLQKDIAKLFNIDKSQVGRSLKKATT